MPRGWGFSSFLYRPGYSGARYHLLAEKLRLLFLNTYTYEVLEKGW